MGACRIDTDWSLELDVARIRVTGRACGQSIDMNAPLYALDYDGAWVPRTPSGAAAMGRSL